ncbi:MAG: TetR/AcrR family transcriptional regulator [Candidatus Marinimicrobia bacterium]|nr:TetR/AcrR family transcriptional regulator [Candidatus Neomarinimicrobiota bacterium]
MTIKGDQTRTKILNESARVFNRKGFGATTVVDILAASGTTKGNLYFHFSSKEEIGLEVLKREKEAFMNFLDETLDAGSPGQGLKSFFQAALEKHSQQDFIGGCIFGNTALEASDTSPALAGFVASVFDDWIAKISQKTEEAQQAGQIRQDVPARDLAEMVVATIEGGIMQARLFKSEKPLHNSLNTLQKILEIRD